MSGTSDKKTEDDPRHRFRRLISAIDEDHDVNREGEKNARDISSLSEKHFREEEVLSQQEDFRISEADGESESPGDVSQHETGSVSDEDTRPVSVIPPSVVSSAITKPIPERFYVGAEEKETEEDIDASYMTQEVAGTGFTPGDDFGKIATVALAARQASPVHPSESTTQKGVTPSVLPLRSRSQKDRRSKLGCAMRAGLLSLFVFVSIALCIVTILFYQYYQIASTLPNIDDLRQQASQFETTRLYDRNGNVLYELLDPNAGRRTYVPLDRISPYFVAATVATEDKGFYTHPGFDPFAILRAFWQNYQGGETISGASTITQQLARNLLFTPQERVEQTYQRKIREAVLATEITRRYTKDEILELYLNENYYGNLAYGIEAAAETYFGTTADKLTLGQAAFLAGLPQAPSVYDVYTNRDLVFERLEDVLILTYQTSQEQGCIYVSNNPQRICLDPVEVTKAASEIKQYEFESPDVKYKHPHWVNYVRFLLEAQYDAQTIYRSGFSVYTTLDPVIQEMAEDELTRHVTSLKDHRTTGGALVALRPSTGEILAMVGSPDFYSEENSGQVNMAVSPRQPGSAMKPLTYIAAFEKDWTPGTLIWDVPSEFPPSGNPEDNRPPYKPVNFDDRFHGPVTVRSALANSYNVPAVKTLQFVGIYDNPETEVEDGFISFARRLGITTLNRSNYGLSLTLGGGEVTLLELTGAYATLANSGRRIPPVAITKIVDHQGHLIYEYQQPAGEQVVRPEHTYLISDILSDNQARTPAFGANSVLDVPFKAAVKTGTTNDFRDGWTVGYTPDLAVGVWVGNADYTPMLDVGGITGAAPIWANFMTASVEHLFDNNPSPFIRPYGVVDYTICAISGTEPSKWCPSQRTEIFAADQPPLRKEEDLWQEILVDTWTGLRASIECSDFTDEMFVLKVDDPWARRWIKNNSKGSTWAEEIGFRKPVAFAPSRDCNANDPRPNLSFVSPRDNETIRGNPLEIFVEANATDWFDFVRLEYIVGDDSDDWETLHRRDNPINRSDLLYTWDLLDIPTGKITLRLYMKSTRDTYAERSMVLNIQIPTPTPTSTPTPTFTPTPTPTPTPTQTPTQTPTPTETIPPPPTNTPNPTDTQEPTPEPTATPAP